jgi:hypothetical protein
MIFSAKAISNLIARKFVFFYYHAKEALAPVA